MASLKKHEYCTYILTYRANTVFYIGVTSDLTGRIWQHKNKTFDGFTSRYNLNKLVHYEEYQWIHDAIVREKQLKGGSRQKKIDLIVSTNPGWLDLSDDWYD